jgi:hypothetical protein
VLRCDCGFEARAEHEDELVAEIQRHAWEAHAMALAPDEARSLALRADALQCELAQANRKLEKASALPDRVRVDNQGRKS